MLNCYSGPARPWHPGCGMTPYQWGRTEANQVNAQQKKHLHQSFPPARSHIPLAPPAWNPAPPGLCITGFGFATGQAGLQYKMPCTTAPQQPHQQYSRMQCVSSLQKVHASFSTVVMMSIVVL